MKFDLKMLSKVANGACRVYEQDGGVYFGRFTEEQGRICIARTPDFARKVTATSCIALKFETDSSFLYIATDITSGSSRSFFSFDLYINGEFADCMKNFDGEEGSLAVTYPLGEFSKRFELGEGTKNVELVFPFSSTVKLTELSVADGASVTPIHPDKRMILFGDSITHGYDASHPSFMYAYRLAKFLGAEPFNKAIGGETFVPALAASKDSFEPDYITVAYGTNDWCLKGAEELKADCVAFFENLANSYPSVQKFAILPIWRKDRDEEKPMTFDEVRAFIAQIAEKNGCIVIDAYDFVPHDERYFSDLSLHPNHKGYACYYEGLKREIGKYIK